MKKVGNFFFSFIPFLLANGIQYLAIFFMIGVGLLFFPAMMSQGADPYEVFMNLLADTEFNTCVMVIYSMTCICVFGLWYYHKYNGDYLPSPKKTFNSLQLISMFVFVPGAQFACNYLITIIAAISPRSWEAYERLFESGGVSEDVSLLMLFYSVILAPIGEELIFRGVTMRAFRKAIPFWLTNILQAILFGIFHMNIIQGCYAAALGLLLGYVCEKGGSIYYSILMHFLFNLWGMVLSEFLVFENELLFAFVMFATTIISFAAGFLLFYFGGKQKKKKLQRLQFT